MRIAFIARAARFSPNSVGKDMAILAATRRQLQAMGYDCADIVAEDRPTANIGETDAYVSMGRSQDTLNWLGGYERQGIPVVNSTASVMLCNQRMLLTRVLEDEVAVPPHIGGNGYWVKRGYGSAETADDVRYAKDRREAERMAAELRERGIVEVEVRAHVPGDVVKFYAVRGTDFFRCYYPGDDGDWKFGSERHNGKPCHYAFDEDALRRMTARAADVANLDIYGGDCVIRSDGQPVLVDLNDWPSFARCRDEAATAIAQRVEQRMSEKTTV
ncbi:MAG: hypothetical protein IJ200_11495 [Prevotella sp.]|nr:hypothetical protein [Prevotella sp.]